MQKFLCLHGSLQGCSVGKMQDRCVTFAQSFADKALIFLSDLLNSIIPNQIFDICLWYRCSGRAIKAWKSIEKRIL